MDPLFWLLLAGLVLLGLSAAARRRQRGLRVGRPFARDLTPLVRYASRDIGRRYRGQ